MPEKHQEDCRKIILRDKSFGRGGCIPLGDSGFESVWDFDHVCTSTMVLSCSRWLARQNALPSEYHITPSRVSLGDGLGLYVSIYPNYEHAPISEPNFARLYQKPQQKFMWPLPIYGSPNYLLMVIHQVVKEQPELKLVEVLQRHPHWARALAEIQDRYKRDQEFQAEDLAKALSRCENEQQRDQVRQIYSAPSWNHANNVLNHYGFAPTEDTLIFFLKAALPECIEQHAPAPSRGQWVTTFITRTGLEESNPIECFSVVSNTPSGRYKEVWELIPKIINEHASWAQRFVSKTDPENHDLPRGRPPKADHEIAKKIEECLKGERTREEFKTFAKLYVQERFRLQGRPYPDPADINCEVSKAMKQLDYRLKRKKTPK